MAMIMKTMHISVIAQGMCIGVGVGQREGVRQWNSGGTPAFRGRRMERTAEKLQTSGQRGRREP